MASSAKRPGIVPSISDASRVTGYSRQTLHRWKAAGCPAFNSEDGNVDLGELGDWLIANGLGLNSPSAAARHKGGRDDERLESIDVAIRELKPCLEYGNRMAPGHDFGKDSALVSLHALMLVRALTLAGHIEAAEHVDRLWKVTGLPVMQEIFFYLGANGLSATAADEIRYGKDEPVDPVAETTASESPAIH